MSDKSVSDAVRHLEQMRDEGFLSEEQFRWEVRDLLKRREAEVLDLEYAEVALRAKDAGLGDMVVHSDPVDYDDTALSSPELSVGGKLQLEKDDPDNPAFMPHHLVPPLPGYEPKEAGRVVVTGKVPWDDKGSASVGLKGHQKLNEEDKASAPVNTPHKPMDPITRERLARLATRTNQVMNRSKNPEAAFLLSLLLPGLGHAYFGSLGSGVLLMVLGGLGWVGVLFGEYWALYILAPLGLLSAAMVHRNIQMHNRYIDMKRMAEARRGPVASRLNVEKSIREAGAKVSNSRR